MTSGLTSDDVVELVLERMPEAPTRFDDRGVLSVVVDPIVVTVLEVLADAGYLTLNPLEADDG